MTPTSGHQNHATSPNGPDFNVTSQVRDRETNAHNAFGQGRSRDEDDYPTTTGGQASRRISLRPAIRSPSIHTRISRRSISVASQSAIIEGEEEEADSRDMATYRQRVDPRSLFSPPFPPDDDRDTPPFSSHNSDNDLFHGCESWGVLDPSKSQDEHQERDYSEYLLTRQARNLTQGSDGTSSVIITNHQRRDPYELFNLRITENGFTCWRREESVEADDRAAVHNYWANLPGGREGAMKHDVWYIVDIEAHRPSDTGHLMKVLWLGSPVRNWEPAHRVRQIAPDLLDEYWEGLADKYQRACREEGKLRRLA
ncbi:hypothetical protein EDB80DRAFT_219956 [Ilyonectria destructans]|nr:hypothetical protein EDB80DRAFT_219956 [Ilyonectria destructans]